MEQVGVNCNDDVPKTYVNAIFLSRGLVLVQIETKRLMSIPVDGDLPQEYRLDTEGEGMAIALTGLYYEDAPDKEVMVYPTDEAQTKAILHFLDQIADETKRRNARKKRDLQTIIGKKVLRDVKKIRPGQALESVDLDCVLLCLVKDIKSNPQGAKTDLADPDGLAVDLLLEHFSPNLKALGLNHRADIAEYLDKNCLYSEGFSVRYEDIEEEAWAFFTQKGYILCFALSRKFVFVYDEVYPNDVYYPVNDLIFKGCRYLQLPSGDGAGDLGTYRDFDGFIFYGEDIDVLGKMNRFFTLNNVFYLNDRYFEAENALYNDRDSLMEVKRISDRMFGDFSYLPFCQYDEWAAICEKMKEDDFFLRQLIEAKADGSEKHPSGDTTYTIRIMDAFNKGARALDKSLKIGDVSIAKGLLWGYFNSTLVDALSREWVRIAGDIVREGDSLENAFSKYFNMAEIESDKAYYLGLYIYYLMDKKVLTSEDFLENYERCMPVYRNIHKTVYGEDELPPEPVVVPASEVIAPELPQVEEEPAEEDEDEAAAEEMDTAKGSEEGEEAAEEALAQKASDPEPVDEIDLKEPAVILAEKREAELRTGERPIHHLIGDDGAKVADDGDE